MFRSTEEAGNAVRRHLELGILAQSILYSVATEDDDDIETVSVRLPPSVAPEPEPAHEGGHTTWLPWLRQGRAVRPFWTRFRK